MKIVIHAEKNDEAHLKNIIHHLIREGIEKQNAEIVILIGKNQKENKKQGE